MDGHSWGPQCTAGRSRARWGSMNPKPEPVEEISQIPNTHAVCELRSICVELAGDAAKLVKQQRAGLSQQGSLAQVTRSKSSNVDPVTAVDRAAEQYIVNRLRQMRPADGILGEEGADLAGASGVQWVIDPIDGTVNFLYGLPVYAVSVGVAVDGVLAAGAVVQVATGDVYSAAREQGAVVERGGKQIPLHASQANDPATALIATGFSYHAHWRAKQAELLSHILPNVRDIRRLGSAAIDLCHVAEGRVDGYYEHGTHPWDYAAGAVIAHEAGAVVHHPGLIDHSASGAPVIAAAPHLWERFFDLLAAAGATALLDTK